MKTMYVVNASPLLKDLEVQATVEPLQVQINRDFMPHWGPHVVERDIKVEFARSRDIPQLPADSWPIFLNRHSTDEGALGWHDDDPTQNIRTYSRVFVGDCLDMGLNWTTTLSHEALELILDPDIRRVYRMADGRLAAYEACDAVEADDQAYPIPAFPAARQVFMASNFVLPSYFSHKLFAPYDFKGHLRQRCPGLTPGGYMSVTDRSGRWQQLTMDRQSGGIGRRAAINGHRRQARALIPETELRVEEDA